MGAQGFDNYDGTSQRYSQRLIVSLAVRNGWGLRTTDMINAFLQGATHTELVGATGEPLREVNFYLPAYCIPVLDMMQCDDTFWPCNGSASL